MQLGCPPSQLEDEDPRALETMIRILTRRKRQAEKR